MRFAFTFAIFFVAAAGCAALATALPSRGACTAGLSKIAGFQARTFCGPAKATAKVGGKKLSFVGGQCAVSQGFWTVNIGTIELGQPHETRSYFGIALMQSKHADGTYRNVTFGFNVPGKSYLVSGGTLTLRSRGKAASFSGALAGGGAKVTGSVTC
ncbi:MAG: hypothetical protein H0X39_02205 [Actinobacteria bacterium]|nr:hypothetical protein [Actinomycetota bacterium]